MPTEHIAFVAGATGYVGRSVVAELVRAGVTTVAHVRPDSSRLGHWRDHFGALGATVDSTPWDDHAMTGRLIDLRPTLVFALLGTTRHRMKASGDAKANNYEAIDYGLSALLLSAAEASGGSPRFVYLSALGVRPGTRNPYMAARARLEAELQAAHLPWTIARPAFISGDDRDESRPGERIGTILSDGALRLLGARARARFGSLTGPELGAGLVRVALDPAAVSAVIGPEGLRGGTG